MDSLIRMSRGDLVKLVLLALLVVSTVLVSGCVGKESSTLPEETPPQTSESITPQEAFTLIQKNQGNPDLVIIDVRAPEEFAEGYIEGAINIDFYSETFRDELNILDKNKTYLVYCRCPGRGISGQTADIMAELNFREVYVLLDGLDQWKVDGFPTIQKTPAEAETPSQELSVSEYPNQLENKKVKAITPEEAYALMQSNPGYVIIDARTPEAFTNEHIEGAIDIDYQSENFRDELNQLDKSNTTFAYYQSYGRIPQCPQCPAPNEAISSSVEIFDILKELNFEEAYFIEGGVVVWKLKGLPTTK